MSTPRMRFTNGAVTPQVWGVPTRFAEARMEFDLNGIVQRSNIVPPAGFDWESEPRNIISERTAIYGISRSMFRGEWANLRSL